MTYLFEKTVKSYLDKYDIKKEDRIIVAFSGGADSLSLLISLVSLHYTNIKAVYVNHNLRNKIELDKEISLNKNNAKKLGVELVIRDIDKGKIEEGAKSNAIGIEAEARNMRLNILEDERSKCNAKYIATAHNSNDRDEWEIISFFRGKVGFSTIPEYRYPYIRPIINLSHKSAELYCRAHKFEFSKDTTNDGDEHLRCKVRNSLIPMVESVFPSFSKAFENRREIYSVYREENIDIKQIKYMDIDMLKIDTKSLQTSPEQCTSAILNALSVVGKNTNGGRFSLRDVNEILKIATMKESKTLLISDIYVFKTHYLLEENALLFVRKSDVDDAIKNRDNTKEYAEIGVKVKTNSGTKGALKILKDKKVPRVLRPLVPLDTIK